MKKLIHSKRWYWLGLLKCRRTFAGYNGEPVAVTIRQRYTFEASFMPFTWGVGVRITWRGDHKALSVKVLPFSVSIMAEPDVKEVKYE